MRIALACVPVVDRDTKRNLSTILQIVAGCSGLTDLVLFGEAALQGFDALTWNYETDRKIAITPGDPLLSRIRDIARTSGTAVSFGYLERGRDAIYSSQLVLSASGRLVHNFRRVSPGWKEPYVGPHYLEGPGFELFHYGGKRLAVALCGDLWQPGAPEALRSLCADAVLWPVFCDYPPKQWNDRLKHEYAEQAALCRTNVLLVNPLRSGPALPENAAAGGAAHFYRGRICKELPAGKPGVLFVEI